MTCMQHNIEQHISTKVTLPYYICWPAKLQETKLQKPCIVLVKMLNLNIFNLLFSSKNLPKPNKTSILYIHMQERRGMHHKPWETRVSCPVWTVVPGRRCFTCKNWVLCSVTVVVEICSTYYKYRKHSGFSKVPGQIMGETAKYLFGLRVIFPQLWHSSITATATFSTASKKSLYTVSR